MRSTNLIGIGMIWLLLFLPLSFAITVEELVDSYDYSYDDGTLLVVPTEFMSDTNSNSVDDLLTIAVATDASTPGTYTFIVTILEPTGVVTESLTKAISSGDSGAQITIQSRELTSPSFKYYLEVFDSNDMLVYRSADLQSAVYTYEQGVGISNIIDSLSGDNLQLDISITGALAGPEDVSVTLTYPDGSITKTESVTLGAGNTLATIQFTETELKPTHYSGEFTIDSVRIGKKTFDFNQQTASYTYSSLVQSSYISSTDIEAIDTDSDSIYDHASISFFVEADATTGYTVSYDLYGTDGTYITSQSVTGTLSQGPGTLIDTVLGEDIYRSKANGIEIRNAVLDQNGQSVDLLLTGFSDDTLSYLSFVPPPRPDLTTTLSTVHAGGQTTVTVTVQNNGQSPAFNIGLDTFDDESNDANEQIPFLDVSQSQQFVYTFANNPTAIITAIADFSNAVDESNEDNNVDQQPADQQEICNNGIDDDSDGFIDCADANCGQGSQSQGGICCGTGCNVDGGQCSDASTTGLVCADGSCTNLGEICHNGELESSLACSGTALSCTGGVCKQSLGAPAHCEGHSTDQCITSGIANELECTITGNDCELLAESATCNAPAGCNGKANNECSTTAGLQCVWTGAQTDDVIEQCGISCGASAVCDSLQPNTDLNSCGSAGQSYFEDTCGSSCGSFDKNLICRSSTFAGDCTAHADCNGVTAGTNGCTLSCQPESAIPDDPNKLSIKDSLGVVTAWLGDAGNIVINGNLEYNSGYQPTAGDEFVIEHNSIPIVIVDTATGNMYVKGILFENQQTINEDANADEFIIKDTLGNIVLLIDESGNVYMQGSVYATQIVNGATASDFYHIKDSAGTIIATYDDLGNFQISGTLEELSSQIPSANDEWILRFSGQDRVIVDTVTGNMYLDGTVLENQASISSTASDEFIVKDSSGDIVILVDVNGNMKLKGLFSEQI